MRWVLGVSVSVSVSVRACVQRPTGWIWRVTPTAYEARLVHRGAQGVAGRPGPEHLVDAVPHDEHLHLGARF